MITATGWTWEYIDEFMTLPRYEEMREYWDDNPPVHIMVAAYLGHGEKQGQQDGGSIEELMQAFPMG